jgi:excisionase family DNA binding protein
MRKRYTPLVSSCLTRLSALFDADTEELRPVVEGSRILTPNEVAFVLDCSTATVSVLVREEKLNALHLLGATRFREEDVMKFLRRVPEEKKYAVA